MLGDATTANVAVLGAAVQVGCIPLHASSIEEAITLNGVAVEKNLAAFRWGRASVADPAAVCTALAAVALPPVAPPKVPARLLSSVDSLGARTGLTDLLRSRVGELTAFQDERCARTYLETVQSVADSEGRLGDGFALTDAVARYLFQLTAYKDEYEVARLLLAPEVIAAAEAVGGTGARVTWKLHPPMLRALGMDRKIDLGPWTRPAIVALAKGKRLRGTKLDPFGRAHVRKLERDLVAEYRTVVERLHRGLTSSNHAEAVRIASLPDIVRGYEDRKVLRAAEYRSELKEALTFWPQ